MNEIKKNKVKESKDFTCPKCGCSLSFTVDKKHVKCPKCGRQFL